MIRRSQYRLEGKRRIAPTRFHICDQQRQKVLQKVPDSSIAGEVEKTKLPNFVDAYDKEMQMQQTWRSLVMRKCLHGLRQFRKS